MRHRCLAATLTLGLLPLLASLARLVAPACCPDLVAPLPTPAQLTAIALAAVAIGAEREHPAAAWFTALAWPKAFNVIVRRPHLTNLHQSF